MKFGRDYRRLSGMLYTMTLLCFLTVLATTTGLAAAEMTSGTLRTVREVNTLSNNDAKHGYPVELEGVVTYSDPEWGLLFMEDDTGAIFINVHSVGKPYSVGARIGVHAVTGSGDIAPLLVNADIRVLGVGTLPHAKQLSLAQLDAGVGDSLYVRTEGVLRPGDQSWDRICYRIFDGKVWALVVIPQVDSDAAKLLVGAKVRVRGVSGARLDRTRKRLGAQLFVSRLQDIEVEESPGMASSPRLIETLNDKEADSRFLLRVHIRGTVIWERPGLFFADDGSGTIGIQTGKNVSVDPGRTVDILGFPTRGEQGFALTDVVLKTVPAGASVGLAPAVTLTAAKVLKLSLNRKRVQLRGRLIAQTLTSKENVFLLEDGDQRFRATLPRTTAAEELVQLPLNAIVDITGIALIRAATTEQPESLLLFMGSPADVVLIQNGSWFTFKKVMSLSGGAALLAVAVLVWITQLRRTVRSQTTTISARLQREMNLETQYKRLFERNLAAVFRWRSDGTIIDCNEAFAKLLGVPACADLVGKSYWECQVDCEEQQQLRDALACGELSNRYANLRRADGGKVCLLENITAVETAEGILYETTAIDVTQLRQNQADLQRAKDAAEYQALNDVLTGLPNRRLLSDRMTHMLARARREANEVALLYIDLDGFKLVNDSLGHAVGDALLVQVAGRLQSRVRQSDTLARLGGDEFVVVLAGLQSRPQSTRVADDLLTVLAEPFCIDDHKILIGASIGMSLFPAHAEEISELLQQADTAMYAAKRDGKNRAVYYTPELGSSLRERLNLEHQLRGAIARDEIDVHYQPEFDVASGDLIRFEALARWTHPMLGAIPPDKFIPVAEQSGLIVILGAYILEKACVEAAKWQSLSSRPIQLAVNVSNIQLRRENLAEEVINILRRTGLRPELLQLELTESVMMSANRYSTESMEKLRAFGISLAIDDFGTGYSCLSALRSSPFDSLKIDRSFIKELTEKPEAEAMVLSVLGLAHNLGMRVIVEGIEEIGQLDVIKRLGGDEVQGYLLGHPTSNPRALISSQYLENGSDVAQNDADATFDFAMA